MKKMALSLTASTLLASFILVGCGSDSSTSSTSNNQPSQSATLSGSPKIGNVDYTCGDYVGSTTDEGKFYFNSGDTCKFTFGGLNLSIVPKSENITLTKLVLENNGVNFEALESFVLAGSQKENLDYENLPDTIQLDNSYKKSTKEIKDFSTLDSFKNELLKKFEGAEKIKLEGELSEIKASLENELANKLTLEFSEIGTPVTEKSQVTQQISKKVFVNGEKQSIDYKTLLKTGEKNGEEIFGLVKDFDDNPIMFGEDSSPYICNGTNDGVGSGLDYTSFIKKGDRLFMVSQFECQIGAMYKAELEQNSKTGELSVRPDSLEFVSQKDEFGGFVHCAGQKTPWESHLGSEEYETDARSVEENQDEKGLIDNKYYDETAKFWGNDAKLMSPYYYGWTPEVILSDEGDATYKKHYAMGRFSHELSYVMPDKKTVYMSDDGTNVGLFMFIADKEEDLSSGTLYAAKWTQTSEIGKGSGEASLSWINLGHATNDEIKSVLDGDNNVKTNDAPIFSSIFEVSDVQDDNTCLEGYTSVNTSAGQECLKLKDGKEKIASRLETRRYAAYKGATTEFRKEEGITFDPKSKKLFVAMSSIERGMENEKSIPKKNSTKYDIGGNNDIKVEYNKCGAIYSLDVSEAEVKDTTDNVIDSSYVVKNMKAILEGKPTSYDEKSPYFGNSCDVNAISNPDNITFVENSDVLMIGEDTSKHKNNVVWAYNTKTKLLTRVFTTPLGAETTSPFWYTNLKDGYGYMSVVTQHPETEDKESAVGYVGPFKNLEKNLIK